MILPKWKQQKSGRQEMLSTKPGISFLNSAGLGKGWTFAFVSFRKILTLLVSPLWRRSKALHWGSGPDSVQSTTVCCPAASTHCGGDWSLLRQQTQCCRVANSAPWAHNTLQQEEGPATRVSLGQSPPNYLHHFQCFAVPTSPYSMWSVMTQCHIQVVTWSLGVMYQSNNGGKQLSGSKVLPRALQQDLSFVNVQNSGKATEDSVIHSYPCQGYHQIGGAGHGVPSGYLGIHKGTASMPNQLLLGSSQRQVTGRERAEPVHSLNMIRKQRVA